jgi:hypothetical protein
MDSIVDLNPGSGFVYGCSAVGAGAILNTLIDAALIAASRQERPRDYLGASRIGEPCSRRLAYELSGAVKDEGREFGGALLRIFDLGHQLEELCIGWLRTAGFDLRTRNRSGAQFGFAIAGGRIRGHIDGVIVAGPNVGIAWPALWEHKALGQKSWTVVVKRGVRAARPIYFAQMQLYMAYMDLGVALFTATNRDSLALYHEIVAFDAAQAQALSDKAVAVLRAVDAGEVPPRIAHASDFYLCRRCDYARRCWEANQ